ncbi:MAG: hypothetical protein SFX73_36025 [Kofleriaceae bacterium]|nr:hypothetical protein [Kofleriaceae bacterium]
MRLVAIAVLVSAACKQAKDPPAASELIAKTRALSQKICACRDQACATPLLVEWNGLTAAATGTGKISGIELTSEQVEALITEDQRVLKSVAALAPAAGT